MNGLNENDFSARWLDNAIPGFTTPDPLAERHPDESPYLYCGNNPVNRVDPTGMEWFKRDGSSNDFLFIQGRGIKYSPCYSSSGVRYDHAGRTVSYLLSDHDTYVTYRVGNESGVWREEDATVLGSVTTTAINLSLYGGGNFNTAPDRSVINSGNSNSGQNSGTGFLNNVSSIIQQYTSPSEDLIIGATGNQIGNILKNRAVYGKLLPKTIIRTAIANVTTSTELLEATGTTLKVAGVGLGVVGIGMSAYEIGTGQKNLIGEGGLDLIMGGVGFIPGGGWIVSGAYFGGKALMETTGNDFWNH